MKKIYVNPVTAELYQVAGISGNRSRIKYSQFHNRGLTDNAYVSGQIDPQSLWNPEESGRYIGYTLCNCGFRRPFKTIIPIPDL